MPKLNPATPEELKLFLIEACLALPNHRALEGKPRALKKCLQALHLFAEGRIYEMTQIQLELVLRVLRYESQLDLYLPTGFRGLNFRQQERDIVAQLNALRDLRQIEKAGSVTECLACPVW